MANRWSLKKVFLSSLIGALSLSALVGIYIFIVGDFGETETKILITTLSLAYFSVTSLACAVVLERKRALLLAVPGLLASGWGFVWSLLGIWGEWDSEWATKTMVILVLFAFSFAQSSLLSLARLKKQFTWVFVAALGFIFALAVLLSGMLIFEEDDELLIRMVGVLGILDAAATLSLPILHKLGERVPEAAPRPVQESKGPDWRIELTCPRCGHQDAHPVGLIRCPECSLEIRVSIAEPTGRSGSRRFQFGLKTILLVFLLVSLPLGWIGFRIGQLRRQAAVVRELEDLNPQFSYVYGNVRSVSLANTPPDRFDASALARLKALPDLIYLDLRGMPITDRDLVYLQGIRVDGISLSKTQITDAGLVHFERMSELNHLDVTDTAVTAEGVQRLTQKRPDLYVNR